MGNWSINPNTLASIDDNGKATFQEHTQDTNYTITYNDGTSGNITKTFTVYACSQPPVDCSTYNFDDLTPRMAHTAFERIPIAQSNYNKEQLSWTINDNWITDVTVSSYEPAPGAICWRYGIGVVANPTTDERNGSVTFTSTDGCSFTGHCTQAGQPAVEWIDLGLPSGKLWRAWNVGSSLEIEYGNYYQYGKGSRQYAATSAETSYTGTEDPLSSSLDAATQALNNANVHMPTVTEYKELTANTTYSNVTINGISGGKFTSSNGNYIFLPFGGEYKNGTKELVGIDGYYLSSTPNGSTSIHRMIVNSNGTHYDGHSRILGLMVRPVSGTTAAEILATLTLNNGSTVDIEGSGELTKAMTEPYKTTVTKAEIKNTCTSIGESAFDCYSKLSILTSVTIPNSVTSIDNGVFYQCTSLTSVTIPNSVTSIDSSAFAYCSSLTSIDIPNTVISIDDRAFEYCTSLTSVTIPSSVTSIGHHALSGCTNLNKIIVEPTTPPTIGSSAFDSTNNCPIYVPCESVNTYKTSWWQYADRITCEGGDETYTVYVTSDANEQSCAKVLIADGGSIEFTLSIYVGDRTHTLKYLVSNRQVFGKDLERFGTINVPIGKISSFDFNCLSTNTGNILKANSSSNGNKLPQLTTQWSTLDSNTELWEGGIIPNLCTSGDNGNRFVVSWDINTTTKTIIIFYRYQQIG